jgi:hypothetical protein
LNREKQLRLLVFFFIAADIALAARFKTKDQKLDIHKWFLQDQRGKGGTAISGWICAKRDTARRDLSTIIHGLFKN